MTGEFDEFRYPMKDVRGTIRIDTSAAPLRNITMDLSGRTDNHLVTLKGHIQGARKRPRSFSTSAGKMSCWTTASCAPCRSGPGKWRCNSCRRRAGSTGSRRIRWGGPTSTPRSVAERQDAHGQRFTVMFKQSALQYDQFPYPWENVSGVLIVHPDRHWECKNFHGTHAGGEITVDGCSEPLPGRPALPAAQGDAGRPEIVRLHIHGRNLLLDREFEQSLSPAEGKERKPLQNAWRTLALAGRLNFDAEVVDHPNHPQDIDVSVNVRGCTMKPNFFNYALDAVSGSVRYSQGQVYVRGIHARHGNGVLGLSSGLIQLKPGGGYVAWLRGITGQNVQPDQDLLLALPEGLRKGFAPLRLDKTIDVGTTLILDAPPGGTTPVKVWWDGGLTLTNASIHAGLDVKDASGQFSCRGHYDGQQLRGMFGDWVLQTASVLGQPLTNLHGRMEILPDTPDVVRVRDFKASLFGGSIGGEARLDVGPMLRYDVLVEALDVQLEQFGRHNMGAVAAKEQLNGPARVALHLQGEGTGLTGLSGHGRVDVVKGKMGQLPVLLDLVKAFGLRVPDRTAFEEAHMIFGVEGLRCACSSSTCSATRSV